MGLFDYFDFVRIINAPHRDDRRQETHEEFSRNKYPLSTEQVKFHVATTPTEALGFPNPGVRGCYLSHLHVLKDALAAKAQRVLIFEDDIQFSRDLPKLEPSLVEALANMPWDIAYFGHVLNKSSGTPRWQTVDKPMTQAHFYGVNGKTLPSLIQTLETILDRPPGHPDGGPMHYDGALDTYLSQNKDRVAIYFSQSLGFQRPSPTDLHQRPIADRIAILRPLVKSLRRIKQQVMQSVR